MKFNNKGYYKKNGIVMESKYNYIARIQIKNEKSKIYRENRLDDLLRLIRIDIYKRVIPRMSITRIDIENEQQGFFDSIFTLDSSDFAMN